MLDPNDLRIEILLDRPTSGQWHCGPNASWVTVTHMPSMMQVRAYHRSQHKARDIALSLLQLMLDELGTEPCAVPELFEPQGL